MILKSVYVYGFGKLVDRYFSFSEGLNIVKAGDAAGTVDLFAFVKALLCGFGEERDGADNAALAKAGDLPLRSKARTAPDKPFGGEADIVDNGSEYFVTAKWGDNNGEDLVTVKKAGGAAEILTPGEPLCKRLWDVAPSEAALLLFMPADSGETAKMLDLFRERAAGEAGEPDQAAACSDAEDTRETPKKADGLSAEMAKARLEELKNQLAAVDKLEEKLADAGEKLRKAEKEQNEIKRSVKPGPCEEERVSLRKKSDDAERIGAIRADAEELREEIADEEKYVKKLHAPWLILLWILAVMSAAALVLLTLFPKDLPAVGDMLKTLSPIRFPLLIGAGVAFILIIILIAAVSGAWMKRLTLLKDDLEFRKKQLSELLFNDLNVNGDEDEFFENVDRELNKLRAEADKAKEALSGAAGNDVTANEPGALNAAGAVRKPGETSSGRTALAEASDKRAAAEAERDACLELLRMLEPYPVLAEKCSELESFLESGECGDAGEKGEGAPAEKRTPEPAKPAATLAASAAPAASEARAKDGTSRIVTAVNGAALSEAIRSKAERLLLEMTFGKRGGLKLSENMVPYIDDNGSARGLGSFDSETVSKVLLSLKLAQLSVSAGEGQDKALDRPAGLMLLQDGSRCDMSGTSALSAVIDNFARSGGSALQIICAGE
jgi:hypothetical protein